MTYRLGIYGGAFDPPHLGHLILAETAADRLDLARVLFAPTGEPPHKDAADVRAPAEHRVAMVERAIADNPRFDLTRLDVDRPGPHYSVDLLKLVQQHYPDADLYFLIGGDSLRDLPAWSRPEELITLARLAVMRRPFVEPDVNAIDAEISGIAARIDWVEAPLIDIAASDIVRCIAEGRSVRYQVPDSVRVYIEQHNLYRTTGP